MTQAENLLFTATVKGNARIDPEVQALLKRVADTSEKVRAEVRRDFAHASASGREVTVPSGKKV